MSYVPLHVHSTVGSLLDGVGTPEEYFDYAEELGLPAIAITDHGHMHAHREWMRIGYERGIKPILGVEAYFSADRFDRTAKKDRDMTSIYEHIILIAQNDTGLRNLYKLGEESFKSFWHKPIMDFELLEQYNEGIIATSACIGGVIAKPLQFGLKVMAEQRAQEFSRIFNGRFYIEHQHHNPDDITEQLADIAKRNNIPMIVTDDCHHPRPEDLELQEIMLCLAVKPQPNKDFLLAEAQKLPVLERLDYTYPDRTMTFTEYDLHLKSEEEHSRRLAEKGLSDDLIKNTQVIADMVEPYTYHKNLDTLPKIFDDPDGELRRAVFAGLEERGVADNQEYIDRANYELEIIAELNFSPYFHVVHDMTSWADSQGIRRGVGRGSGCGSLVNYALKITGVDPIKHKLLFSRFIDPTRPELPDIDTDYEVYGRERVKEYVRRKYGYVAGIATLGYFKDKGTVRDAARVFRIPLGEVNRVLKKVNNLDDFATSNESAEFRKKYPEVLKWARKLQGRVRTHGMHAGGLLVSDQPISDIVPVHTATVPNSPTKERVPVASHDMDEVAEIGLIKIDALGLKALSIIDDAVNMIEQEHGKKIAVDDLPLDDKNVYAMLSRGETAGVFQVSAPAYTKLLKTMKGVSNFEELAASNALVRPGAMNSSFGEKYMRGKNEGIYESIHPSLDPFTEETYYSFLYQEQLVLACRELADMSEADAHAVRKAVSKKKLEELVKWKEEFVSGASEKIKPAVAEALWHDFEASADYSFNKSHAVAYSMLTYQMAWLKYYYPIEFMVATLNNEAEKTELVNYMIETKRLGIRVKLPHVNDSEIDFSIQSDENGRFMRMGLKSIKYISSKIGQNIVKQRPFESYDHLMEKVEEKGTGLSTRVLGALNAVNAAVLPGNPSRDTRENWYEYLNLPAFSTNELGEDIMDQLTPLDEYDEEGAFVVFGMVAEEKTGPNWRRIDILDQHGRQGVFVRENSAVEEGNAYIFLIGNNSVVRYVSVEDLINNTGEDFEEFLRAKSLPDVPDGMQKVIAFSGRKTKKGQNMGTVVFSDEHKNLTAAMVWPSDYIKVYSACRPGEVVDVKFGKTDTGTLFVSNIL